MTGDKADFVGVFVAVAGRVRAERVLKRMYRVVFYRDNIRKVVRGQRQPLDTRKVLGPDMRAEHGKYPFTI